MILETEQYKLLGITKVSNMFEDLVLFYEIVLYIKDLGRTICIEVDPYFYEMNSLNNFRTTVKITTDAESKIFEINDAESHLEFINYIRSHKTYTYDRISDDVQDKCEMNSKEHYLRLANKLYEKYHRIQIREVIAGENYGTTIHKI